MFECVECPSIIGSSHETSKIKLSFILRETIDCHGNCTNFLMLPLICYGVLWARTRVHEGFIRS